MRGRRKRNKDEQKEKGDEKVHIGSKGRKEKGKLKMDNQKEQKNEIRKRREKEN